MNLNKYSNLILDYCVGIRKFDEIVLYTSTEAFTLIRELWNGIVLRGGYPRLIVTEDILAEIFYRYAPQELLEYVSPIDKFIMERDGAGELQWVVAPYLTKAMAQEAGMSIIEFEEFGYRAIKLHTPNPIEAWIQQAKMQERIIALLSKIDKLRIVDDDTDLVAKVGGIRWMNDDEKQYTWRRNLYCTSWR